MVWTVNEADRMTAVCHMGRRRADFGRYTAAGIDLRENAGVVVDWRRVL